MKPLTKRQGEILRFIIAYKKRTSIAPAFWEISKACGGICPATVHEHVKTLDMKGYIVRTHNQRRTITVLHDPDHPTVCPACERPFATMDLRHDSSSTGTRPLPGKMATGR